MSCNQCGGELEMTEQAGGIEAGWFKEFYECVDCGANGYIRGKSEQSPVEWSKCGRAFRDPPIRTQKYDKTYSGRQCKSMDAQKSRHRIINNGR